MEEKIFAEETDTEMVDIKLFSGFLKTNEKLLNLMAKEIVKECQEGTIFYRLGNKLHKGTIYNHFSCIKGEPFERA